jgi:hypothetical protein
VGTVFERLLFWGALIAIPINLFIFIVAYKTNDLSLQLLPILNIGLLSTQFLRSKK